MSADQPNSLVFQKQDKVGKGKPEEKTNEFEFFFFNEFIYFNWWLITLHIVVVFAIHWRESNLNNTPAQAVRFLLPLPPRET